MRVSWHNKFFNQSIASSTSILQICSHCLSSDKIQKSCFRSNVPNHFQFFFKCYQLAHNRNKCNCVMVTENNKKRIISKRQTKGTSARYETVTVSQIKYSDNSTLLENLLIHECLIVKRNPQNMSIFVSDKYAARGSYVIIICSHGVNLWICSGGTSTTHICPWKNTSRAINETGVFFMLSKFRIIA